MQHGGTAPPSPQAPRPRILVVDDEPDIGFSLQTILETMVPAEVETATSARDAQAMIRRGSTYDVVISDFRMPGMDGAQFLRWLGQERPHVCRIMMSAFVEGVEGARAEGVHFLHKPFHIQEVVEGLDRCLGQATGRGMPGA